MKPLDTTFEVDPLFHHMSALFDQGGAQGLLLFNRSVYAGSSIMVDPHDTPEDCFRAAPEQEPDTLVREALPSPKAAAPKSRDPREWLPSQLPVHMVLH